MGHNTKIPSLLAFPVWLCQFNKHVLFTTRENLGGRGYPEPLALQKAGAHNTHLSLIHPLLLRNLGLQCGFLFVSSTIITRRFDLCLLASRRCVRWPPGYSSWASDGLRMYRHSVAFRRENRSVYAKRLLLLLKCCLFNLCYSIFYSFIFQTAVP